MVLLLIIAGCIGQTFKHKEVLYLPSIFSIFLQISWYKWQTSCLKTYFLFINKKNFCPSSCICYLLGYFLSSRMFFLLQVSCSTLLLNRELLIFQYMSLLKFLFIVMDKLLKLASLKTTGNLFCIEWKRCLTWNCSGECLSASHLNTQWNIWYCTLFPEHSLLK